MPDRHECPNCGPAERIESGTLAGGRRLGTRSVPADGELRDRCAEIAERIATVLPATRDDRDVVAGILRAELNPADVAVRDTEMERLRAELAEARAKIRRTVEGASRQIGDVIREREEQRQRAEQAEAAIARVRALGTFWSVCAAETVAAFGRGVLAALDASSAPESPQDARTPATPDTEPHHTPRGPQ